MIVLMERIWDRSLLSQVFLNEGESPNTSIAIAGIRMRNQNSITRVKMEWGFGVVWS